MEQRKRRATLAEALVALGGVALWVFGGVLLQVFLLAAIFLSYAAAD